MIKTRMLFQLLIVYCLTLGNWWFLISWFICWIRTFSQQQSNSYVMSPFYNFYFYLWNVSLSNFAAGIDCFETNLNGKWPILWSLPAIFCQLYEHLSQNWGSDSHFEVLSRPKFYTCHLYKPHIKPKAARTLG